VATCGEVRAQRWRYAARRARELIWAVGAVRPLIGDIPACSPGGPMRGARQKQAGSWCCRGAAHADTTPARLHHLVVDAHDCLGWPGLEACTRLEGEIVIGTDETRLSACASCRSPIRRRSRTACSLTWLAARRIAPSRLSGFLRWARRVDIGQTVLADPRERVLRDTPERSAQPVSLGATKLRRAC
jgi:hypothetical protein